MCIKRPTSSFRHPQLNISNQVLITDFSLDTCIDTTALRSLYSRLTLKCSFDYVVVSPEAICIAGALDKQGVIVDKGMFFLPFTPRVSSVRVSLLS